MILYAHRLVQRRLLTLVALLVMSLLAACADASPPDPPTSTPVPSTSAPSPTPTAEPTSVPAPTRTPVPPKELTVCQREEPNTLFVYGSPSRAARNVLDAVYDGPIDTHDYVFTPVILERLPSFEEGDAALHTVTVEEGERVLDARGEVVELAAETVVRDAAGREVAFQGDVVTMTQTVVTFTLRADVAWADGEPLTAEDSLFSYELAQKLEDAALQRQIDRTAAYEVQDGATIVWAGVPGFRDTYYLLNFYHPLPQHTLEGLGVQRLLAADAVQRRPLGWGPFVIETWAEGDRITLVSNPHYFRASEGLPHLDRLIFRFVDDPLEGLEELLAGRCDVLSEDLMSRSLVERIQEAAQAGEARLISAPSSEWEHLDFGIQPARWSARASFFQERVVREAIAHCVDRQRIADEVILHGAARVADSYVLPQHPLHGGEQLHHWAYDPSLGRSMLQEAGWLDADEDGILEAHGAAGVAPGTVFSATLLTTRDDPARRATAAILEENLAECGVGLAVDYLPAEVFYADGPDGPVFGRQFDLALFSWLNGVSAPCELYLSSQIPTEENWWATSNNPGYASEAYDEACRSALESLYGTEAHARYHRQAQRIFSHDLPVLPLYFVPRLAAARADVTGLELAPAQQSAFWNIESVDVQR